MLSALLFTTCFGAKQMLNPARFNFKGATDLLSLEEAEAVGYDSNVLTSTDCYVDYTDSYWNSVCSSNPFSCDCACSFKGESCQNDKHWCDCGTCKPFSYCKSACWTLGCGPGMCCENCYSCSTSSVVMAGVTQLVADSGNYGMLKDDGSERKFAIAPSVDETFAQEKMAFCSGACSEVSCGDDEVCDCGYCLSNDYCDNLCDAMESQFGGCPDGYTCSCGMCAPDGYALVEYDFDMDDFACTTSCDEGLCIGDYCFDYSWLDECDEMCADMSCDSGYSCVCGECLNSLTRALQPTTTWEAITTDAHGRSKSPAVVGTVLALGGVLLLGVLGFLLLRWKKAKEAYAELDEAPQRKITEPVQLDLPTISSPMSPRVDADSYGGCDAKPSVERRQSTEIKF